jgi:exopolysaccharide biosynthesis polyprenyl glycosylphosphotransferase
MFPGFADTKDRLRAVACGIVNLLLARILFAWPLGLATIHGTLPVQGPAWFGVPAGIGFLYGTLFTLFCQTEGVYRPPARFAVRGGAASVFKAAIWAWLVVESTVFLVKESPGLSLLISVSACLHLGCIAGFLALRSKVVEHPVDQGTTVRHIVIVGTGGTAVVLASRLRAEGHLGRQFEGFVDDPHPGRPETLGLIQDLESLAQTRFLDEVIVCLPDEPAAARRAVFLARRLSLDVKVVPEVYGCTLPYDGTEMAGDIPVLTLQTLKRAEVAPILKRALDVASAAGLLLLLAPALCLIALLIRINSPGCVFYSAQRVGRKGRAFLCYKFRTMRTDADEQKHVLRVRNERSGPFFKLKDDPRITTVGKWLRKYSLDELPQLWNILLGDMSLVGPRPHPLDDHARYAAEHLLRLTVTPGLTGLWQVTARSDPSFERSMALDREYIAKQSFWMDLWILFRTVREVAVGSGV